MTPIEEKLIKGCGRKLHQYPFIVSAEYCGELNPDWLKKEYCPYCKGKLEGYEMAQKEFIKWLEYEYYDIGELFMVQNISLKIKTVKVHIRDKIVKLKASLSPQVAKEERPSTPLVKEDIHNQENNRKDWSTMSAPDAHNQETRCKATVWNNFDKYQCSRKAKINGYYTQHAKNNQKVKA